MTWCDPHCHFLDPVANPDQHSTLVKSNLGLETYLPENYIRDFDGLGVEKIVHLEVLPDDLLKKYVGFIRYIRMEDVLF